MNKSRPPKKAESLEVRVPHAVKRAFMARARQHGRTASAVLREFIDAYLAGASPSEDRSMYKRYAKPVAAAALIGTVIAAHALIPTAASATPDFKTVFDQLDRDKDGKLSPGEMAGNAPMTGAAYLQHQADLGHGAVPLMVAVHSGMMHAIHGGGSAEAHASMQRTFAGLDGDSDGAVTFGEFESHHLAVIRRAFDSIDADQDGRIAKPELDTATQHLPQGAVKAHAVSFDRLDADGDGAISWEEFLG